MHIDYIMANLLVSLYLFKDQSENEAVPEEKSTHEKIFPERDNEDHSLTGTDEADDAVSDDEVTCMCKVYT